MQLSDYKRKYRYKSDQSKHKLSYTIAIIISIVAFLLIWFLV
ncbi:hypothetical protein [Pedobacter sp. JY14-1]|nr:hypothetical protein [Pedobacter sp. JY14-1]